ncbi:MAG: DoxX family protein [Bacteroidia bacterium]
MDTFHIIILLGLILGLIAYGSYHVESYRRLGSKSRNIFFAWRILSTLITITGGYMLARELADFGAPGRNVTEAGANIFGPIAIIIGGLANLFAVGYSGRAALKKQSRSYETTRPVTQALVWGIRIYVFLLFTYSGFVKANDYIGFSYKLEEYFQVFADYLPFMAGFWKFWEGLAEPLAWFISVFEIALAVAILLGWRMRLTAWLTMLMMVFFTILTGFSAITGEVTDCGCFGDAIKLKPWMSFTKDLVYLVILTPLFLLRNHIKAFPTKNIALALVLLTFLISGVYGWYCHENLPVVDYRAYKIGTDLNRCTTEPGEDGIPKCKDWEEILYKDFVAEKKAAADTSFVMPEPLQPLQGKVLMVVAYKLEKASEESLRQSGDLARALREKGVNAILMTSTGPSTVEGIAEKTCLDYPVSFRDATMLKTIIRANPGYVLLNNGTVVAKWHHNNIPDVQEVMELY